MSIGREEYFQLTGINDARKRREFLGKKEGPEFKEILTQTPTCKTTSLSTLLEYAQYSSHDYWTIHAHHKKLRKLNFTQKELGWESSSRNYTEVMSYILSCHMYMCVNWSVTQGEKTACFYLDGAAWFGDIKVSKSLKGSRMAPMQKFWRQVRLHPWVKGVAMVNKWGTSKTCCKLR
ncbi:hypothetical protein HDU80_007325 [Chytriomyces hyalinus]|nr:hypothetical protein HDU80_007325 [Chytriomyces hyalinus]